MEDSGDDGRSIFESELSEWSWLKTPRTRKHDSYSHCLEKFSDLKIFQIWKFVIKVSVFINVTAQLYICQTFSKSVLLLMFTWAVSLLPYWSHCFVCYAFFLVLFINSIQCFDQVFKYDSFCPRYFQKFIGYFRSKNLSCIEVLNTDPVPFIELTISAWIISSLFAVLKPFCI